MTQRILGPEGSKRRRRFLWVPMLTVAALALFFAVGAQAVHDTGVFQLDGDATTGLTTVATPPATDDWDKVCHQYGPTPTFCSMTLDTTASTAGSWVAEPNPSASIFTGGGSKDPQDISNWLWKDAGGLPDKDNLLHSFAVRYSQTPSTNCPSGTALTCELLFFGSDRLDNSGDAQQGFWFFQNKITTNGTSSQGGTTFTGVHKNGDLLIISDFSNGGTNSIISVYQWDNTVSGNLKLLQSSATANCATASVHDAFCGLVNPSTITMPWPFVDKSGTPANQALNGEFYEGGINLSLLGLAGECFSSVASETRSSTSTTATLKDFILGQLAPCTPALTTQASTNSTVVPGVAVHDTATITVTGGSNAPDPTGTVNFFLCSDPLASPTCTTGGTPIGSGTLTNQTGGSTTDGIATALSPSVNCTSDTQANVTPACFVGGSVNPLANGYYCFRATWAGDATYGTFSPALGNVDNTNECFRVLRLSTTTVTSPQTCSGTPTVCTNTTAVNLGASVYDHAVVSGFAAGGAPTGTVNFYICNPSQVTGGVCAGTGALGAGTLVNSVTPLLAGPGANQSQATSSVVTANQLGVWCFRADYVSDNAVYTGSFDNTNDECFTVSTSSSATSAQNWLPNDLVTISTPTGTLAGTLSIKLLSGSCDPAVGTVVYTEPVPNSGAFTATAAGATYNTTNGSVPATTFKVITSNQGTYYWRIVFTPTSSFAGGAITKCETSTVTINDNP